MRVNLENDMPAVVRNLGDLRHAKNVDGVNVERTGYLYFHGQNIACLNTDNHFLYRSRRIGSSILCTCGGQGVSAGYHAYSKHTSVFYGNEVLVCYHFIMGGKHADGST
jgi:hypothetical protein